MGKTGKAPTCGDSSLSLSRRSTGAAIRSAIHHHRRPHRRRRDPPTQASSHRSLLSSTGAASPPRPRDPRFHRFLLLLVLVLLQRARINLAKVGLQFIRRVAACDPMKSGKSSSGVCPAKSDKNIGGVCPVTGKNHGSQHQSNAEEKNTDPRMVPAKCPFGYDSGTFKLGPLSCMICQALLHDCSKCTPCSHKFCKNCISRFRDCPLCGADIEGIEPDSELQALVDRFIDGHARIKRSHAAGDAEVLGGKNKVIYEDVSMERGAFLVQQAMRAFRAQNIESAKSRLSICAEDIREELKSSEDNLDLRSQLGAVLGMLGDCCRTLGDAPSAITHYEESAEFLSKLPTKDLELVHTLSVSLNKIGDLRYYDGDLQSARSYYARSLDVRRSAVKENSSVASQVIDVATSLAKVADVDRNLGNESAAVEGFKEAIQCLEKLKLGSENASLEQKRLSVLEFLHNQLAEK